MCLWVGWTARKESSLCIAPTRETKGEGGIVAGRKYHISGNPSSDTDLHFLWANTHTPGWGPSHQSGTSFLLFLHSGKICSSLFPRVTPLLHWENLSNLRRTNKLEHYDPNPLGHETTDYLLTYSCNEIRQLWELGWLLPHFYTPFNRSLSFSTLYVI